MSRETNSLLLRYGINVFWSSSLSNPSIYSLNFQFNSLFNLILRNFFFRALKIQYTQNVISLYLFYFKEDRFSFLFKFLKLKKIIITSLITRRLYSFRLYKKFKKFKLKKPPLFSLLVLTSWKTLLIFNLSLLKKKKLNFVLLSEGPVFTYKLKKKRFFTHKLKNRKSFFTHKLKQKRSLKKKAPFSFYWDWRVKMINSLLKFKWLAFFFCLCFFHVILI